VQLGKLAQKMGTSEQVKQFGQQMVTDHSKANDELKAVAKSKNIALPKDLDAEHKATADRLSKLEGDAFDKAYSAEMLKDHKKDVAEFEKASKSLQDPDLKGFATKTLPVLKQHLQHAQGLAGAESAGKKK
jgi:putative membrane protein